MKPFLIVGVLVFCFLGFRSVSFGATITFSGNWTTPMVPGFPLSPPGADGPFSGAWALTFDDTMSNPVGNTILFLITLDSFTWTGFNYGAFDLSNVSGEVFAFNGNLTSIAIFGSVDGSAINGFTDDFTILYNLTNSTISAALYGRMDTGGAEPGPNTTGSTEQQPSAPIPEPGTLLLLATGLFGLAGYRWSQRRRERAQVG